MDERTNERTNEERMNGWTDGRTDNTKTISPSRFHRRGIMIKFHAQQDNPCTHIKINMVGTIKHHILNTLLKY